MTPQTSDLIARLHAAGQGHCEDYLNALDGAARERLEAALASLDLDMVQALAKLLTEKGEHAQASAFEAPEIFPLERGSDDEARAVEARKAGEALLKAGQVGYVLVAGGQASRLGYDGPKGNFPVGPVTDRTLFHFHAQRLLRQVALGGPSPSWYVMTSPANDQATRDAFEDENYFGLAPENVFFFQQEMLPALDAQGRILFKAPDEPFMAPNGHGGVLLALQTSGALDDMKRKGIRQISYFQVDNPLVRPVDPLFLGLHEQAGAGMSSKVVEKTEPGEKVGVLGRADGALGCIEYSDLPENLREARDGNGKLTFRAGNIAVHALTLEFVDGLTKDGLTLPWHIAVKQMKTVDLSGAEATITGHKFESFVFDALGQTETSVTLEVDRALEFSPVKNKEGSDSPASAKRDLCKLFSGWAAARGDALPASDAAGDVPVEVDPLLAESQSEFVQATNLVREERGGGVFYTPGA